MTRKEKAQKVFLTTNCAQAVVGAFSDLLGVDEAAALRLTSGFGTGVGGLQLTCGAVVGGAVVLGGVYADETGANKAEVKERTREFAQAFEQAQHSLLCSDLLPQAFAMRDPNLPGRPCLRYVWSAVELLTQLLGVSEDFPESPDHT